jgi:Tol biopolymer transport system component
MPRFITILLLAAIAFSACGPAASQATQPPPVETQAPAPSTEAPAAASSPTASASASPTATTPLPTGTVAPPEAAGWIAYTGMDGNLALVDRAGDERREITEDAVSFQGGQPAPEQLVSYCCAQWSSDGSQLAYSREVGTAISSGYQYISELWVYEAANAEARMLLQVDESIAGFAWQPGAHLIAYGRSIPTEYFIDRAAQLAPGIWALEADSGETYELVAPQRGLALVRPQWSPDGRFLSFDEIFAMEGRGYFAYYDFETREYVSWEEIIGQYDWSPDGTTIAYDFLAYTATGEERIWLRERQGGVAQPLSPDYGPGYAFRPRFSPQGDRLAYLANLSGPETNRVSVFVVDLPDGEPRELGVFTQVDQFSWSPDGGYLVLSSGPFENPQVVTVSVSGDDTAVISPGRQPTWQPGLP